MNPIPRLDLTRVLVVPGPYQSHPMEDVEISVRARNALMRNDVLTLGQLHGVSIDTLLRLQGLGAGGVVELVDWVGILSEQSGAVAPPLPRQFDAEPPPQSQREHEPAARCELPLRFAALPVEVLNLPPGADCALADAGYPTLGTLARASDTDLPLLPGIGDRAAREIASALARLTQGEWDPTLLSANTLPEELRGLLSICRLPDAARDLEILEQTHGFRGGKPLTLEAVGERLDLTRERVRQLRKRAEDGVRGTLRWLIPRSLDAVRHALRSRQGIAHLDEVVPEVSAWLNPSGYAPSAYLRWLLSIFQDPSIHLLEGDLLIGPPVGAVRGRVAIQALRKLLAERAGVAFGDAVGALLPIWVPVEQIGKEEMARHAALLLSTCAREVLPGVFSARAWKRADWAEWVLQQEGSPLHFREVAARVNSLSGREYHETGFDSLLNAESRFVRVGAGDFALTTWGAQRYTRFDEVIERYLCERGRPEHVERIADDLLSVYTITETTVAAMLNTNGELFLHFGGGYWGLRGTEYAVDAVLEREIETELRAAASAMAVDDLRRRIVMRRAGADPLPSEQVEYVLFVSPRFRRCGTKSPAKFALVEDAADQFSMLGE